MDKNEYKARAEEIRKLIAEERYREAVEIADTIDWRNVPNGMMLCTVSDLYKMCRRYEDSRDVLLLAYQRNPKGRLIIYSLCELSIKLDDVVNAVEYYKEYLQVAPRETGRYILQYKLYEAQEASLEERIAILEELQKRECKPKWMYELAYLYHRVGLGSSCVEECNQLILFFGEGKYVVKALELKALHEPLSPDQEYLYNHLTGKTDEEIQIQDMNVGQYNTIDLQKELANNLAEVLGENAPVVQAESPVVPGAQMPIEIKEEVVPEVKEEVPEVKEEVEEVQATTVIPPVNEAEEPASEPEAEDKLYEVESLDDNDNAGQISMFENADTVSLGSTLVYSREEVEKALGGSKVVDEVEESAAAVNFDEMLSLEGDGQISLVVPEQEMVTKQITGQLSIDEVLAEYERIRLENERRWSKDVEHRIKQSTGAIFKSFDESSKDGLLEQIEQSVQLDPDSVAYGPNLTEEEIIYLEEDLEAQKNREEEKAQAEEIIEEVIKEAPEEVKEEPVAEEDPEIHEITLPEEDTSTEPAAEEEPTAEELAFDRTPFLNNEEDIEIEMEPEEKKPEPEDTSNTAVLSDEDSDYLARFAAAGAARDLEEQRAIEAFEQSMAEIMKEEAEKKEAEEPAAEEAERTEESEVAEEEKPEETEAKEEEKTEEPVKEVEESLSDNTSAIPPIPEENISDDFTDEQWERFESFLQTENGREQIKEALGKISDAASTGNVIIGSTDIDSAIDLGKALILEQSGKGVISGKVAKIKASSLNAKDDAETTLSKVYNGAIIIQDAEELRRETLEGINKALTAPDKKMLVIMTTSHRQKHRFIMENTDLLEPFNISIDIEVLDNNELAKLAGEYARKREYSIDEMGMLALHNRIDERQTNSHAVTLSEVKDIVDEAIKHASRKNMGHFFDLILGKRYDDNDMIVLGEKDFAE